MSGSGKGNKMTRPSLGKQDVNLAGAVQRLLLPKSSPLCSWCCMDVKNRMAAVLGGDYYDFIELEDGCQVVFLGDVTGHGLHASVVMSLVYGFLHRAVQEECDPYQTLCDLNDFLRSFAIRSEQLDYFFSTTLFFGIIEPENLMMRYINAGHPPGLVKRDSQLIRLATTGHPLGYFDHPEYKVNSLCFEPGDRLLLYTDGLIDAMNRQGERFGAARLEKSLLGLDANGQEFLQSLFAEVTHYLAGATQHDDCTGVVVDFRAKR